MSFRRPTVLVPGMFAFWLSLAAHAQVAGTGQSPTTAAPSATNSISNLSLKPQEEGSWQVDFDYSFTGDPPDAMFHVDLTLQVPQHGDAPLVFHGPPVGRRPEPGAHHVSTSFEYSAPSATSTQFIVSMASGGMGVTTSSPGVKVLATARIDKVVTWPSAEERQYYLARDMVTNGSDEAVRQARPLLEQLLARNPKFDPAFLELARIAMGTTGGPEGFHQAETLIKSALEIRPDSANAKILLGFVYAHQHRFPEAQALFVDAARSDPPNLWLWTNWGGLLEMQGQPADAVAKYREAIKRTDSLASGGARMEAYRQLLKLLAARKDFDAMEALYKQRIGEYGAGSCFSAEYARFELNVRRNPQAAINLARSALNQDCEDASSRQILGLASYVEWAQESGTESADALNQARIYLPTGAMALYLLASHDSTLPAAKKLLGTGENIDQKDNDQMTALAYALERGKIAAAEGLLGLGARPDIPVGVEAMPVALLPVLDGNLDAIRALQRAGVDFAKLRYRGATAIDFAKQSGNTALLEVLTRDGGKL